MPEQITPQTDIGAPYFAWMLKEYESEPRHKRWFIFMGVVSGLCLLYAMFTGNFMFVTVLLLFAVIMFLQSHSDAPDVRFEIGELGILIGNRLYLYNELTAFYLIYQPPEVKTLYIETKSAVRPTLRIPLSDQNPLEIREVLSQFLPEDFEKEEEPISDRFGRNWKLQ